MRFALLLLVPTLAHADARFGVHAAAGMESGLIQGVNRPAGVAEVGLSVDYISGRWGLGIVLERVGRTSEDQPSDGEHKLDVMFRLVHPKVVMGLGAGVRKLSIDAPNRPASTVWGADLLRMQIEIPIVRVGLISLAGYFSYTYGLYKGEIYGERFGDMPYPTRDFVTLSNAMVLGLQTSIHSH